jgi:hypothetical protein
VPALFKILNLFPGGGTTLAAAEYLPEYDGIHLQTSWEGLGLEIEGTEVVRSHAILDQRSRELEPFFAKGGVLLVELVATPEIHSQYSTRSLDIYWWWAIRTPLAYPADPQSRQLFLDTSASGSSILLLVPGHPLETYLQSLEKYEARFGDYVGSASDVTVLAENRSGEPIAIEMARGRGMIVAVPAPRNEHFRVRLSIDLMEMLRTQLGSAHEWPLKEEEDLRVERQRVLGTLIEQRKRLDASSAEVQVVKAKVLQETHVRRALRYWERATRVGATPKTTVDELYALLEMLKDFYISDWKSLGHKIGVSNNSIARIKTFANRPELHLRHTNAADPLAIEQSELDHVIKVGHEIVMAFIEHRFKELK